MKQQEPIVLIHGALGSQTTLQVLYRAIQAQGYPVYTLDLTGHGSRSQTKVDLGMPLFVVDVLDLMETEKLNQVHIIGFSMGGYVALKLAATHPEKVRSICTLGTKFHWTPDSAQQEVKMLNPEKIKEKVPSFSALLLDRHGPQWENLMHQTAQLMLNLGNGAALTKHELAQVNCEVLLLRGADDTMVSEEETLKVADQLKHAYYQILPNTPHPIEKVDQAAWWQQIQEFLQKIKSA